MKSDNGKKNRLPILRERLNELMGELSTTEFADKVGVSRQTMGFYLNGDRIPDSATLMLICKSCNVSSDWLLGFTEDPKRQPSAADDLHLSCEALEQLRHFSHEQKQVLEKLFRTKQFGTLCDEIATYLDIPSSDKSELIPGDELLFSIHGAHRKESELEEELYKKHPELLGRISISYGVNNSERLKEDLIRSFSALLLMLEHKD